MNVTKRILILFLSITIFSAIYPNDNIEVTIECRGIGSIIADRIIFEINLRLQEDEYRLAFENHKQKMQELTEILNDYNIADSVIHFSLFSIHKGIDRTDRREVFTTDQRVTVLVSDFIVYEKLQMSLISKGFYDFSTKFSASKPDIGKRKAIKNAIFSAEQQIAEIAKGLNKKGYKIVNIKLKEDFRPLPGEVIEFSVDWSRESLEKIPQKINYVVELEITYILSN